MWGIFLMCLGTAMLLTSNATLRVCVFLFAFTMLFFFMSWTFIQLINPEYVDDALGYTLIGLSILISVPGAYFAQRMSINYLSPLFAGIFFWLAVDEAVHMMKFEQNEVLTIGMEMLGFVFGLYLG